VSGLRIEPHPTDEEAAAIAAAYQALWPRPHVTAADQEGPPAWRFSGRWWMPSLRPLRRT